MYYLIYIYYQENRFGIGGFINGVKDFKRFILLLYSILL